MALLTDDLKTLHIDNFSHYISGDDGAWWRAQCVNCANTSMMVVARTARIRWMRCTDCGSGLVENWGTVSPGGLPLSIPDGVIEDVLSCWTEVRKCLSVRANSAAVMMCRKLLFHIAVAHGLTEKDDKGWAPNFSQAVKHLEDEEVITKKMRPWVDRIKDVGNGQNHEISPIDYESALDVAKFTQKLLELAFEMDALMAEGSDRATG